MTYVTEIWLLSIHTQAQSYAVGYSLEFYYMKETESIRIHTAYNNVDCSLPDGGRTLVTHASFQTINDITFRIFFSILFCENTMYRC